MGLGDINPKRVSKLDSVDALDDLERVGKKLERLPRGDDRGTSRHGDLYSAFSAGEISRIGMQAHVTDRTKALTDFFTIWH
ncbi:MAG: hypothetical protein E8D41_06360 [Nitrospira sp.]|nr:MAG: hypothetical protein E8D41_06360 [Nitrospira sp.]